MKNIYVGIDLGTTYSAFAYFNKDTNQFEILKNSLDKDTTPSVIYLEGKSVIIGEEAKQAQKDGASIENISAGLSISVVKNALYKVIRATTPEELGKNIVVQGGTFYNNAVLRAFEQEMKTNVIRPNIAGIMGAYGAALFAKSKDKDHTSSVISKKEVNEFSVTSKTVNCGLCGNNCLLTVNTFNDDLQSFVFEKAIVPPSLKRKYINKEFDKLFLFLEWIL